MTTLFFQSITLSAPDPDAQRRFYSDVLGMAETADGLHYGGDDAHLIWQGGVRHDHAASPDGFFWKIGITVDDLDHAVEALQSAGVECTAPRQFRDIGYLSHLRDPAGYPVELLQRNFEGRATSPPPGHAIAAQACLSHITLRVRDIATARSFCEARLGLRLMSVQPVASNGFTLYFYAKSEEPLPVLDLAAVENREWLWARPYTLLELQHLEGAGALPTLPEADSAGLVAINTAAGTLALEELAQMR